MNNRYLLFLFILYFYTILDELKGDDCSYEKKLWKSSWDKKEEIRKEEWTVKKGEFQT